MGVKGGIYGVDRGLYEGASVRSSPLTTPIAHCNIMKQMNLSSHTKGSQRLKGRTGINTHSIGAGMGYTVGTRRGREGGDALPSLKSNPANAKFGQGVDNQDQPGLKRS